MLINFLIAVTALYLWYKKIVMKYYVPVLLLICCAVNSTTAQTAAKANYDEAKMPAFTLPDPLLLANGKKIKDTAEWKQKQRPYLLQQFATHMYGKMPGKPQGLFFKHRYEDSTALGGKAICKQVTVFFNPKDTSARMEVLLYLPKGKEKAPVFIGLNFAGNQTIHTDANIFLSTAWIAGDGAYKSVNNRATEASRGIQARRWPVDSLIANGYGLATAYYGDLEPDHPNGWKTGIRTTMQSALRTDPGQWSAIGAWAWGLSRMMDYLETEPGVDAHAVAVTGHSRLGKAALWAAANDTRFAMVIANESGEGGAALARRWYGETIESINTAFPHWFVSQFKKYNNHPELLPVDQHMLLALAAPRPLYVASAADDQWADPKGEFLGAKNAGPVYALWGKPGLGISEMPPVDKPVGHIIRYHIRSGRHDMLPYDWTQFIQFADVYLKEK
jgi:hypothetical protein